jgi:hypothetical protein
MLSPDLVQMTLLGCVTRKNDYPTLLYAMTLARPKAPVYNIAQASLFVPRAALSSTLRLV